MDSLRDVLMNKVQSFVQKIDLKQGLAVLGSVVACSLFAVVKGLHGEDVTAGEIISMDESINTGDGKSDEQEPEKVETERQIPRSDLDENWFDRLISMITFFKCWLSIYPENVLCCDITKQVSTDLTRKNNQYSSHESTCTYH